jgi:predicted Rossmann fold nucleotide-binding protein DprA/Smf involved in DNA uptake
MHRRCHGVDFGITEMRVAVVGSRRRSDREAVEACVSELAHGTVVISGGASGPDRWAEEAARAPGSG